MDYPKISIVTPCFNSLAFLEETIFSILNQNYPNLEYIIIDGGSTDGSIDVIKKYEEHLFYWISEKDEGLYDALNKGFKLSTGNIMGWLNADDLLHKGALYSISSIFKDYKINWLQGYPTLYNNYGATVSHNDHVYSKYHFHLKNYMNGEFIQQESTYWSRELWDRVGKTLSTKYKYAGDFELWMRFFRYERLTCTNTLLGGYRVRKDQLSRTFYNEYLLECADIIEKESLTNDEKKQIRFINMLKNLSILRRLKNKFIKNLYGEKQLIDYNFDQCRFLKK